MNPELRRYFWLEFSLHRLIAMPGVLALVFLLTHALNEDAPLGSARVLAGTAIGFFIVIVGLWGTRLAADAVIREARERTWDGQRLSALEPWTMTWGKLLGAPLFPWYGGFFCLVVLLATAPSDWPVGRYALLLFAGAVLLHAMALLFSLLAARHEAARERRMPGLLVFFLLLFGVAPWLGAILEKSQETVHWWGGAFPRLDFLLVSTTVFAAWAVFGAYRLMCQALQVRTTPAVWVAFSLFTTMYLAGLLDAWAGRLELSGGDDRLLLWGGVGLLFNSGLTYLMLFAERTDAQLVRRLLLRVEARQWRRALEELPCWPVSLLLAAVSGLLFTQSPQEFHANFNFAFATLPLILLAVRDCALYLFFSFGRSGRNRVEGVTLLYLLLLYWLAPMLLRAMGADTLAEWVLPSFWKAQYRFTSHAGVILALQAALMTGLAVSRWRRESGLLQSAAR